MNFRFPRLTPTVKKLLIVLVAAFVAVAVAQNVANVPAFDYLALNLDWSGGTFYFINLAWQPFTYWLVYPPVPEALLNFALLLLGIYFFLAPFEESFGAKRTIQLSACGLAAAALATIAFSFIVPSQRPIYGAAPIALASLGAFPVIARNAEIYFMFLVRMKAWHVIAFGLGWAALSAVLARDVFIFVQYAAALGAGIGYAKWMTRPRTPKGKKPPKKRKSGGPDLRVVRGGEDDPPPRWLN
jgi:membrane associated rhomboid family serine protease